MIRGPVLFGSEKMISSCRSPCASSPQRATVFISEQEGLSGPFDRANYELTVLVEARDTYAISDLRFESYPLTVEQWSHAQLDLRPVTHLYGNMVLYGHDGALIGGPILDIRLRVWKGLVSCAAAPNAIRATVSLLIRR